MSAFLGPIHYWLYNKIQQQQAIIDALETLGKQYNLNLKNECDEKFGTFENKSLEDMIDHGHIHGWLQEKVSQVEYKYAYSVTNMLNKDPNAIIPMKSILNEKGKELGQSYKNEIINAPKIYQIISDNLLDGMPCDHANSMIDQTETEVTWKRNLCVHEGYWDAIGGNINYYYELRNIWMDGFVQELGFSFHKINSATYRIKKEA